MTLSFYTQYQELFRNCVWFSDMSASGSVLNELISGSNGTISGATINAANQFGISKNALLFDGSDDYVSFNAYALNGATDFTCIIVARVDYWKPRENAFISIPDTAGTGYMLNIMNYGTTSGNITPNIAGTYYGTFTFDNYPYQGTWHIYTIVRSGTSCLWYVDGDLKQTITVNNTALSIPNTATSKIGLLALANLIPYAGYMGGVLLFTRAVPTSEVAALSRLLMQKQVYPVMSGVRGVE